MRDISKKILVGVALLTSSQSVFGWGTAGHRTVAEIANRYLSPQIKQTISPLLGKDSLADSSLWADQVKNISAWSHTRDYHFENIDDNENYLQSIKTNIQAAANNGGAVMAVLEAQKALEASTSSQAQKSSALRFLIHFVGDLHQPLHSGRPADKGGNLITRNWNGKKTNLHSIWDSSLIESAYPQFLYKTKGGKVVDEKKYADYLQQQYSQLPVESPDDLEKWLDESLQLRPLIYQNASASETSLQRQFISSVDRAIFKAGVRLASIINRIFMSSTETAFQQSFRKSIESILGPISDIISLDPRTNKLGVYVETTENSFETADGFEFPLVFDAENNPTREN